jgi:hypothetical protein
MLREPPLRFLEQFLPFEKFKVDFSKLYPQLNRKGNQLPAQLSPALRKNLVQKALEIHELVPALRELMQMAGGSGDAGFGEEGGEGGRFWGLVGEVGGGRAGLEIF